MSGGGSGKSKAKFGSPRMTRLNWFLLALAFGLLALGAGMLRWSVVEIDRTDAAFYQGAVRCPAQVVDVWERTERSVETGVTRYWTFALEVPCLEGADASPTFSPETLHSDEPPLSVGEQVTAANLDGDADWYIVELLERGLQVEPASDLTFLIGLAGLLLALAGVVGVVRQGLFPREPLMQVSDDLREAVARGDLDGTANAFSRAAVREGGNRRRAVLAMGTCVCDAMREGDLQRALHNLDELAHRRV